jgi:hypothetical protein
MTMRMTMMRRMKATTLPPSIKLKATLLLDSTKTIQEEINNLNHMMLSLSLLETLGDFKTSRAVNLCLTNAITLKQISSLSITMVDLLREKIK